MEGKKATYASQNAEQLHPQPSLVSWVLATVAIAGIVILLVPALKANVLGALLLVGSSAAYVLFSSAGRGR